MAKHSRKCWDDRTKQFHSLVLRSREMDDDEYEVFRACCERLDLYYVCEAEIKRTGLCYASPGGVLRKHPLLGEQKQAWTGFLAGLRLLGFNESDTTRRPGRPSEAVKIGI